jgi:hypothetical protein
MASFSLVDQIYPMRDEELSRALTTRWEKKMARKKR